MQAGVPSPGMVHLSNLLLLQVASWQSPLYARYWSRPGVQLQEASRGIRCGVHMSMNHHHPCGAGHYHIASRVVVTGRVGSCSCTLACSKPKCWHTKRAHKVPFIAVGQHIVQE